MEGREPEAFNDSKKSKQSSYGWIFAIASIIVAIGLGAIDKGPPLPPWKDDFDSFDCHSVEFDRLQDRNGFLDFVFKASPSIEYPPEYLPHFISLNIRTRDATMKYSGDFMTNHSRTESNLQFSLEHPFAGESEFDIKCLKRHLKSFKQNLNEITHYTIDYSRSQVPYDDYAKFNDVCLEYEKFLFFTPIKGDHPSVKFDQGSMRFELLNMRLKDYLAHKKVSMTNGNSFLVAPFSDDIAHMILFSLGPLARSVKRNSENPALVVIRKREQPGYNPIFQKFSGKPSVKLADIMCFQTLLMTSTFSNVGSSYNLYDQELELDFKPVRERFTSVPITKNKIALTSDLHVHLEAVKNACKECEVIEYNMTNLFEVVEKVQDANILIGNHLGNLAASVFLAPNATVINASPQEFICNEKIKKFITNMGLSYIPITENTDGCSCKEFRCYPPKPSGAHSIKDDNLANVIKKAVQ